MDKFNFQSLCSTTAEMSSTFLSSTWSYVQEVPTWYWIVLVGVGGYAIAHFRNKRISTQKYRARKTLLSKLYALKGRISFRLFNGVHKDKVRLPSGDVLVNTGNVKSFANKMRKKSKDTDEQKMHTL